MNITLKNGDKLEVAEGADCAAAAKAISEGLARAAVAAKVNGELVDLSTALKEGDSLEIVTLKDKESRTFSRLRSLRSGPSSTTGSTTTSTSRRPSRWRTSPRSRRR